MSELSTRTVFLTGSTGYIGSISNNTGVGVHCGESSHCEWAGATKIDNNGNGGIAIVDHSDAYLDGGIDVSGNTHNGVYVDLSSV